MNPNKTSEQGTTLEPTNNPTTNSPTGAQSYPEPAVQEPQATQSVYTPAPATPPHKNIKKLVIIIVSVLVVLAVGLGVYVWLSPSKTTEQPAVEEKPVPTEVSVDPATVRDGKIVNDCYSFDLPQDYDLRAGSSVCTLAVSTPGIIQSSIQVAPITLEGADNIVDTIKKTHPIDNTTRATINGNEVVEMSYSTAATDGEALKMRIYIVMDTSAMHLKSSKPINAYMITGQAFAIKSLNTIVDSFTIKK